MEITNALCMRLRDIDDETSLTFEVLQALDALLQLDRQYPSDFEGESSIGFLVDSSRGFEEIESLQFSQNDIIFEKAK